jgi:carbon-monoxide dehydrogenase iron sulfur subunit
MKTVFAYPERCIGCKQCQIACAVEHSQSKTLFQAIFESPAPQPRVHVAPGLYLETSFPNKCRHCEPAPCLEVCPTGAITRNGDLDTVTIDGDRCITCAMCAMVCPFDAIRYHPTAEVRLERTVAIKCDNCIERQRRGEVPACVEACKVGALVFGDVNEIAASAGASLAQVISALTDAAHLEETRIPGNVAAWRNLGKSTTRTGREEEK